MADKNQTIEQPKAEPAAQQGGVAVPGEIDHDRVQMLSLRKDGTPDQHNPEMIGDPEISRAATVEQFRQNAVSAADVRERGVSATPATLVGQEDGTVKEVDPAELPQDPTVDKIAKAHEEAAQAAENAAEAAVQKLHRDA